MHMEKSYRIRRQRYEDVTRPFTCGDSDLDDFFRNDSIHYSRQKLATSYVMEDDAEVLAYFAIANDRISVEDFQRSSSFNKFRKRFVNSKRMRGYPAVKLCRLAVKEQSKHKGLGTEIIDLLKGTFYKMQRSACRFLIVDAYQKSVDFYLKNGFRPVNDVVDSTRYTIPMYFDLADMDQHSEACRIY